MDVCSSCTCAYLSTGEYVWQNCRNTCDGGNAEATTGSPVTTATTSGLPWTDITTPNGE